MAAANGPLLFCRSSPIVAIPAGNEVDVVQAVGGEETGIHLLDIDAAMGIGGMTGGAGCAGGIGVGAVAIKAAQALMHAGGCAVVPGAELPEGVGRVALGAEALARVRRKSDQPITLPYGGNGQQLGRKVGPLVPDI